MSNSYKEIDKKTWERRYTVQYSETALSLHFV